MDRRWSTASQEDLISLRELEPSPIDSPSGDDNHFFDDPSPLPPIRSSTLGLSGSGYTPVYYLTRLQRYSSYVFTIYTSFHITNTAIIPLITRSVSASEPYLLLTRPYYQSSPLEPLLITLPIATHILSGLALRIQRRNANLRRYGASNVPVSARFEKHLKIWPTLSWQSISGYILAPLVAGHALTNRIMPWFYEGGSSGVGLQYVSHGFAKHSFLAWSGYSALIAVGAGHFIWGISQWNNWTPTGRDKKAKRRWWTINGITATVVGLWIAGLAVIARGGKADGWIGRNYDILYSKVPLLKL